MSLRPRPLRVLCLHGKQQTASVFRDKIAKVLRHCASVMPVVDFLDAPHELPLGDGDDLAMRSWSHHSPTATLMSSSSPSGPPDGGGGFNGISAASMELVLHAITNAKPAYDVLFGFSQGCLVALSVLLLSSSSSSPETKAAVEKIKGVVLAGCPGPLSPPPSSGHPLPSLAAPPSLLSVLCIVGTKDDITPQAASRAVVAELFPSPTTTTSTSTTIFEHPHAHSIPQSVELCTALESFGDRCWRDKVGLDAAAAWDSELLTNLMEEVELITAVLGGDSMLRELNKAGERMLAGGPCLAALSIDLKLSEGGCATIKVVVPFDYPSTPPDVTFLRLPETLKERYRWQADALIAVSRNTQQAVQDTGGPMLMPLCMLVRDKLEEGLIEAAQCSTGGHDGNDASSTDQSKVGKVPWYAVDDEAVDVRVARIRIAQQQAHAIILARSQRQGNNNLGDRENEGDYDSKDQQELGSCSGGGSWGLTIGLIGKPSAGKSTFFNAVMDPEESKAAAVAAFPFTTIEPNVGRGLAPVGCPCAALGAAAPDDKEESGNMLCNAEYGHVTLQSPPTVDGNPASTSTVCRRIPITIKDVAGLVQGAYQGKGKGNQFLNDLCDADVLVHVVDGASATDAEGAACKPGEGSATSDVAWVRDEVHSWIYDNLLAKWQNISRRPDRLYGMFSGYRASRALVDHCIKLSGVRSPKEAALLIPAWLAEDLHRLVALFVALRFPIVVALNKCDVVGAFRRTAEELRDKYPLEQFVPMAARVECDILEMRRQGIVSYQPGSASVNVVMASQQQQASHEGVVNTTATMHQQQQQQRASKLAAFVAANGGTGVQNVLFEAIARCRPLLLYPVDDVRHPSPSLFPTCLVMKPGSTAHDAFRSYARYFHMQQSNKKATTTSSAAFTATKVETAVASSSSGDNAAQHYKLVRFELRTMIVAAPRQATEPAVSAAAASLLGTVVVCRKDDVLPVDVQPQQIPQGGSVIGLVRVHMNHRHA